MQDFDQAIKLDPKLAQAYYRRGTAEQKVGKVAAALQDFLKARSIDPTVGR